MKRSTGCCVILSGFLEISHVVGNLCVTLKLKVCVFVKVIWTTFDFEYNLDDIYGTENLQWKSQPKKQDHVSFYLVVLGGMNM